MNSNNFTRLIIFSLFLVLINCCVFGQTYIVIVILNDDRNFSGELLKITVDSVSVLEEKTDSLHVFEGSEISTIYIKELVKSIKYPVSDSNISHIFDINFRTRPETIIKQRNRFEIGLGLVEGSDYKKFMKQAYSNISGSGLWIYIELGYSINVFDYFYLTPRVNTLFSEIETITEGFEFAPNKKANIILLPGISGRYYPLMSLPDLFASFDLSPVFPLSDVEKFEFNSGGVSIGAGVGYIFANRFELEIGYLSVPIQAQINYQPVNNTNFGGLSFVLRVKF